MVAPLKNKSFYPTLICLCICIFIATLDSVIVAASLPAIATALKATSSQAYWCGSGFLFAQTVTQPIYGGFAETLGYKFCLLLALGIFTSASLLCALAQNIGWLIGGRVVQGLGSAGINVMVNVIMADLVPLDQRAMFMGMMQLSSAFGLCSGVIIGATVSERATWRWWVESHVFLRSIQLLMKVQKVGPRDVMVKLKNFDFIGMAFFTGSLVSVLYGVTGGGISYSWSSGNIIVSLVIGVVGVTLTAVYEGFIASNPMIPPRIFKDRTASLGYLMTWCQAFVLWAYTYFITLYFMVCKKHSLLGSAIQSLSAIAVVPFAAAAGGITMSITKRFKWINVFAATLMTTGLVLMSRLKVNSNRASQISFQTISAIGGGILFPGRLCAVQAPQKLVDVSIATALVSFFTSLGEAFGVAIGDAVFQNWWEMELKRNLREGLIADEFVVRGKMAESIGKVINEFPENVQDIYRLMMADAIGSLWLVITVFAGIALAGCVISRDLRLDGENMMEQDGRSEESLETIVDDNQRDNSSLEKL
ncbi:hypothetical protein NHQ30_004016 [Ciborinia camelliae]|nr:hypothetical protein NHQ30_004016 [Ciborinia camelliae]